MLMIDQDLHVGAYAGPRRLIGGIVSYPLQFAPLKEAAGVPVASQEGWGAASDTPQPIGLFGISVPQGLS